MSDTRKTRIRIRHKTTVAPDFYIYRDYEDDEYGDDDEYLKDDGTWWNRMGCGSPNGGTYFATREAAETVAVKFGLVLGDEFT